MKYFIIAGEASGDMHGQHLIQQLQLLDKQAQVACWGGSLMASTGAKVLKPISELAFMGFVEVLKNIIPIMRNFATCKQQILDFKPDVVVFIDYPGFNLRMAKWTYNRAYKNMYYISPQIWAWKEKRVFKIKKYVQQMMCILPFEKDFYAKYDMQVHYVGNPLMKAISDFKSQNTINVKQTKPIIALLPGSRLQEINTKLPIMLSVVKYFPDYEFVIAQAPNLSADVYQEHIGADYSIRLIKDNTYALLQQSTAALVTSGTATLETALFGVPEVVCYYGNPISYAIGKQLIKVPYISLVNLIANKKIISELIQKDLTARNLCVELQKLLTQPTRNNILEEYNKLHKIIGQQDASKIAAEIIYNNTIA